LPARIVGLNGATAPEALPKDTIMPSGRRQSREPSHVVLPTASYTTGNFLASGNFLDALDEILLAVVDHVVRAVRLRKLGLLVRANGSDHGRADRLQPLAGNQADAAAAACHSTGSPGFTLYVRWIRYCTVIPSASSTQPDRR
jgi:hypothetical protein